MKDKLQEITKMCIRDRNWGEWCKIITNKTYKVVEQQFHIHRTVCVDRDFSNEEKTFNQMRDFFLILQIKI